MRVCGKKIDVLVLAIMMMALVMAASGFLILSNWYLFYTNPQAPHVHHFQRISHHETGLKSLLYHTNNGQCESLADPCNIHENSNSCIRDAFCGWCVSTHTCSDARQSQRQTVCPMSTPASFLTTEHTCGGGEGATVRFKSRLLDHNFDTYCDIIIDQRVFKLDNTEHEIDAEIPSFALQTFYYFMKDYLPDFIQQVSEQGGLMDGNNHIIIPKQTKFSSVFELFTNYCVRYELPKGTCICTQPSMSPVFLPLTIQPTSKVYIPYVLGINTTEEIQHAHADICIVQREFDRRILNLHEVKADLQQAGYEVHVLALYRYNFADQVARIHNCHVFIAVSGGDLSFAQFLPPQATVIEVNVYKVHPKIGLQLYAPFIAPDIAYRSYVVQSLSETVFLHPQADRLLARVSADSNDEIVVLGTQGVLSQTEFDTIWMRQNVYVDTTRLLKLIY